MYNCIKLTYFSNNFKLPSINSYWSRSYVLVAEQRFLLIPFYREDNKIL